MTDYTSAEFWAKAPEGATHYCPEGAKSILTSLKYGEHWLKDGYYKCQWMKNWKKDKDRAPDDVLIQRPATQPAAWNGPEDGLPPVGVECEFASIGHHSSPEYQWCIFHGLLSCGGYIVEFHHHTSPDRVTCDAFDPKTTKFRPIRTPEQVAAAEREAAVEAMYSIWLRGDGIKAFCGYLYDEGYRKQDDAK